MKSDKRQKRGKPSSTLSLRAFAKNHNNELVKELCAPAPDAKDLYFPVDYAQCAWKQFTTGNSFGRIGGNLFHFIKGEILF